MSEGNLRLIKTAIPNLDPLLGGGIPEYSINIIAGEPGTGKTILAQHILFNYVRSSEDAKALYMATLSEPSIKVLRYMQGFVFFDKELFDSQVIYHDIGKVIRENPLSAVNDYISTLLEKYTPGLLVIDSFKAIHDIAREIGEFHHFIYDLSVRLAGARTTAILVGEYPRSKIPEGVEFAVVDGIIYLENRVVEEKHQRFLHTLKWRGCEVELGPAPFFITDKGIKVVRPLRPEKKKLPERKPLLPTHIEGLDPLLLGGVERGRSILVSGISGTGKTTLALSILLKNAMKGERALYLSFEETEESLLGVGAGLGFDVEDLLKKGCLRVVSIGRGHTTADEDLEEIYREISDFSPLYVAIDPLSPLLQKVKEGRPMREKMIELTGIIEDAGAVGILISDIPTFHPERLSRFSIEETVVDGIILLTTSMERQKRVRYLEVYKMRARNHIHGRYRMEITSNGIKVLYHGYGKDHKRRDTVRATSFDPLKPLISGSIPSDVSCLIHGGEGLGKSTLAYQFVIEGLRRKESVLFVSTNLCEEGLVSALEAWDFFAKPFIDSGNLLILHAVGPSDSHYIDTEDAELLLYKLIQAINGLPRPCRVVFDSITSLAITYDPDRFVSIMEKKNRLLKQAGVMVLDTILSKTLYEKDFYRLINSYDIVIDLYLPNWGEMGQIGAFGGQALRIRKARGLRADTRPYPYTIRPREGVVLEDRFYRK